MEHDESVEEWRELVTEDGCSKDDKIFVLPNLPTWAAGGDKDDADEVNDPFAPGPAQSNSTPSHKTATTSLKEFCDKQKLNPKFDLISSAGGKFVYEAKLDDVVFTSEANSKKNARNKCSELMLLALKDKMTDQDKIRFLKPYFPEDQIGEIQPSVAENFVDKNPIGELQEYAVALQWPCPDYELIDETGPAHVKSFVMQCTLNKLVSVGTAKSKKLAKREAALSMLKQLGQMKFNEETKGSKRNVVSESLAQLEDCFMPSQLDQENEANIWRSEDKKTKMEKEFESRNNLDLSVESYLNTYQVELTPIDVELVLSNVDSQLPNVNYSHELDKYLNMNGIKYVVSIENTATNSNNSDHESGNHDAKKTCCSLMIHFGQPLTFVNCAANTEEAKQSVAREALIHLIKQQKYKELTFAQLNRLLPERTTNVL